MNSIGTIESVRCDNATGWYHAEGSLTKPEVIPAGAKPSVVFFVRPNAVGPGGKFHDIPYGRELLSVKFDHIGLVTAPPRFEGATFRFNSSQTTMNPIKWLVRNLTPQKNAEGVETQVETKVEGEIPAAAKVDLGNGVVVPFSELLTAHEARMNAASEDKTVTLDPEAEVTLPGGKTAKVKDIIAGETTARLNAAAATKLTDEQKAAKAREDAAALAGKSHNDECFVRLNAAAARGNPGTTIGRPVRVNAAERAAQDIQTRFGPVKQDAKS